ncbi:MULTISPECIES: universal stress protein [Streptosporangium]|uniref:Nucleotide-binding universal stress UspA family protein n=1 Tax=Streptosporangium brasiliense TaxID=47480 RepID=A0ABT9RG90_9ACTN|nr:universal stress protein [Streptosporangium brasiliense]MDP9868277.1 nucleotide-binding universal stress UspA family protein [Streptosporangium brasiliense]
MKESRKIVIGYDGSDFSMQALDWAMDEAELRKLPLTLTHAWRWPYREVDGGAKLHLREAAEHVLHHGADCARACSMIAEVATDLYGGSAAQRLVELSAGAELVVVGCRGLSFPARSVFGSVTATVAAHARSPVIIVRGAGPLSVPLHPGPVVLGLMNTTADEVLDFAFHEAALRHLRLRVIHAGHPRLLTWGVAMASLPDPDDSSRACQERLNERLAPWQEKYPEVSADVALTMSAPNEALRAACAEATLIVAGTGRTARRTGHLGMITGSLVRHASCSVAVVPS